MLLAVKDRILLFGLLPAEGDILSLRVIRKLREALSFSDEENAALQIQQTGSGYHWIPEADQPKEIEIGAKAHSLIVESLKRLDAAGKLTLDHLDIWDKFIPPSNGDG